MGKEKMIKEKQQEEKIPSIYEIEWTDYVLGLLSEDEKIAGNPTTDGLRRIFEKVLNCTIIHISTEVVQSPSPENEKRATVVYRIDYVLNDVSTPIEIKSRSVTGAADVYWGNCDKIYRNHPVAVAETRAEGRALRKALRLRKVVAAEEIAKDIEDHPDETSVQKISHNQINFMDVMAKRLNINILSLISNMNITEQNINDISHDNAVLIIKELSKHQQDMSHIPSEILGYQPNWQRKD